MLSTINLTARAMKVTVVLDPGALAGTVIPDGMPRIVLRVAVGTRTVTASIAAKSVRRAVVTIAETGPDNVALILQGKLNGETIEEAGLSAMAKAKPQDQAA